MTTSGLKTEAHMEMPKATVVINVSGWQQEPFVFTALTNIFTAKLKKTKYIKPLCAFWFWKHGQLACPNGIKAGQATLSPTTTQPEVQLRWYVQYGY